MTTTMTMMVTIEYMLLLRSLGWHGLMAARHQRGGRGAQDPGTSSKTSDSLPSASYSVRASPSRA